MVKIKYNSKNVDRSGAQTPPQPGTYKMKVAECKFQEDDGNHEDRLVFVCAQQEKDSKGNGKGYRFWDYVNLTVDWKVDQWLQAAGVDTEKKTEGEIDTKIFKNLELLGRVKEDHWKGEYRPKLAGVYELVDEEDDEEEEDEEWEDEEEYEEEEDEEDEEDEEEEEDEDWDDEEEEEEDEEPAPPPRKKAPAKKASARKKAAPKKAAEPEDDYDDWSAADLKGEAQERGLAVGGGKSALIARLRLNDEDPFSEE